MKGSPFGSLNNQRVPSKKHAHFVRLRFSSAQPSFHVKSPLTTDTILPPQVANTPRTLRILGGFYQGTPKVAVSEYPQRNTPF